MAKALQIGKSNFAELTQGDFLFVDKTALFIPAVLNDPSGAIVITRPRRWGKSLNMSMLHYFLAAEVNGVTTQGMFDGLAISKIPGNYVEKHQGKSPVIFLSFKDFKASSFELALSIFEIQIKKMFRAHKHLLHVPDAPWDKEEEALFTHYLHDSLSEADIGSALEILSSLLCKHYGKKVYILIDEYDTPLNHAFVSSNCFESLSLLMRQFFSGGMKDNSAVEKGVMTGILRVSKDSMLSGLNNCETYTPLNDKRYHASFGFAQEDLMALFADQGLSHDEPKVQEWYNGYCINGLTLYNPWSIMNCLSHQGELRPYWVLTSDDKLLKQLIQKSAETVKVAMEKLVLGESIEVIASETMRFDQVQRSSGMLWNLLILGGYLKVLASRHHALGYACMVAIPNQEVLMSYQHIFLGWTEEIPESESHLESLLQGIVAGDIDRFAAETQAFLESAASFHDYATQPEAFYHGFMLALIATLQDQFFVFSNSESGRGRPDMILIPKDHNKDTALILEFKHVQKREKAKKIAEQALRQIEVQQYQARLSQYNHIQKILGVGIAFEGKKVVVTSAMLKD